ncbi:hypothetical protein D1007_46414 [Hordeum vulgare]|nr:hypothetical protein D1007_46414 [Hordeum vulgare]
MCRAIRRTPSPASSHKTHPGWSESPTCLRASGDNASGFRVPSWGHRLSLPPHLASDQGENPCPFLAEGVAVQCVVSLLGASLVIVGVPCRGGVLGLLRAPLA